MEYGSTHAGGRDRRGRISGSGYLYIPPPEHSDTVYCDQAHYGPVSGGGAEAGVKGGQAVVEEVHTGFGGDADSGSGDGIDGEVGGDGRDGDGD